MPKQNPFPPEEYERRLTCVRRVMERRGLDALALTTPENIFYLTGYQTFGNALQFLIVTLTSYPHFVLRDLESGLVAHTTRLEDVRVYGDSDDPVKVVADTLRSLRLENARVGLEEGNTSLTVRLHRRLTDEIGIVNFVDGTGTVEECRVVKSPLEIEQCRKAALLTEAGMSAAIGAVAPGVSENDVAVAAFAAMGRAGSEWLANDPIVTSGPRSGVPHTTYARRQLEPGDAVLIELSGTHHRYFAPLMRSCVVGHAPDDVVRMHDACVEALEAAMAMIKPGVTSGEVHAACQRVIDRYGYTENFRKRLGYSVGIGFKSWMEGHFMDLKAGDPRELVAGMVFHMPPALRKASECGVGVSETVVVTETGCLALTEFPRELFRK